MVPPRGPPGAGVGTPPAATDSPVAPGDLLGELKLLQTVMSAEDFSKYEKMVVPPSKEERTKEREQLLWEQVQFQNRLRTQEAGHDEQIAKLEADATKQRTMLQVVRGHDEVCAFRTLVADPSVPTGLLAPLLLRKRRTFWTLFTLLTRRWKVVKMRVNWSGNRFAVLLIGIGATRWE